MIASVRVIGKTYTVRLVNKSPLDKDSGECDERSQTITVNEDQTEEAMQDTLLHEVIHAIDHTLDAGMEERQVRLLATGLIAVFRDNPDLAEYVTRKPKEAGRKR